MLRARALADRNASTSPRSVPVSQKPRLLQLNPPDNTEADAHQVERPSPLSEQDAGRSLKT